MVKVNETFKNLIPPLSTDEYNALEASILKEGVRDAIILWGDFIVDGHNRFEIATRHGLPFKTTGREFASEDDVIIWMIDNQLARRNINDGIKYVLADQKREALLRIGLKNMSVAGESFSPKEGLSLNDKPSFIEPIAIDSDPVSIEKPQPKKVIAPHNTRNEIAKTLGWSTGKVAQADVVFRSETPAAKEAQKKVMSGELTIGSAYKEVKAAEKSDENDAILEHQVTIPAKAHVANNSGNNEWYTPPRFIESARTVMGGIDLDPASSLIANDCVKATAFYTEKDDGLTKEWSGRVWMNPPYSQPQIELFCEALAKHIGSGKVSQACVLVNNATETKWFGHLFKVASAVCFVYKRVRFVAPDGSLGDSPLQGQCIVYHGKNVESFSAEFSQYGAVLYA